ncbi:MAG TPA: hypothetical protein VKT30_12270 [Caulobacteraceae bacterium]|nr:hypothetical protein [Caulobacteraceae bacterium]
MSKAETQVEAENLLAMARALAAVRPDMEVTTSEVEGLALASVGAASPLAAEQGLERAAKTLRTGWLRSVAAETSRVFRSPTEGEVERLSRSRRDAYGYERDFQPERLEQRCHAFFGAPPGGWTAEHVLFSSGQAALATVLLHLAEPHAGTLRVAHIGAYFETAELVRRACRPVTQTSQADLLIVEPVACDGRFATHDPAAIARTLKPGQALALDETLSAPHTLATSVLRAAGAPDIVVVRLVSGLKLLQQGLELANVGIVSVFARDQTRVAAIAEGLKRCRTLTGAGLRFVDALALEAPFFLDREATDAYAERVFEHNATLMRAVMARNRLFKPLGDAEINGAAAPYCTFELATGNSAKTLETLAARIEGGAAERGLLIERGGSFGFRGHRFEVIEPEAGAAPFLRVALGARTDHSLRGLIALVAELAADDAA